MVDANEEGGGLAVRGEKAFTGGGGDKGTAGEYGPEALGVVDRFGFGFQVLGEGARGKVGKIRHEERLSEPKVAFREGGVRNSGLEVVGMMGKKLLGRERALSRESYATIHPVSDFKPRPGTFLPYLEYANRLDEQRAKPSPLALLEILSRQSSRALPIFELQAQSTMDPARYGEALKSLRDAGYITIEGESLSKTIRLTDKGAEVVRLAKPA